MKHTMLVREIVVKKPGTKTGKIYMKLGIPEVEFKKLGGKNDSSNQKRNSR